jgi:hypothetical protein
MAQKAGDDEMRVLLRLQLKGILFQLCAQDLGILTVTQVMVMVKGTDCMSHDVVRHSSIKDACPGHMSLSRKGIHQKGTDWLWRILGYCRVCGEENEQKCTAAAVTYVEQSRYDQSCSKNQAEDARFCKADREIFYLAGQGREKKSKDRSKPLGAWE